MSDRETLAVYDEKAGDYSKNFSQAKVGSSLRAFLDAMPAGGDVLDYGCGPGHSARQMAAEGFQVSGFDASAEMVRLAKEAGLAVEQMRFDEFAAEAAYDGIWANFSLLHAEREDLPSLLASIHRALRPGGMFHIGMKTGDGMARDALGRRYTYVTVAELEGLLKAAGLTVLHTKTGEEKGLAGTLDPFVIMRAHA